jgi:hypothetical protein
VLESLPTRLLSTFDGRRLACVSHELNAALGIDHKRVYFMPGRQLLQQELTFSSWRFQPLLWDAFEISQGLNQELAYLELTSSWLEMNPLYGFIKIVIKIKGLHDKCAEEAQNDRSTSCLVLCNWIGCWLEAHFWFWAWYNASIIESMQSVQPFSVCIWFCSTL